MYIIYCLHSHQFTLSISSDIPNDRGIIAIEKGEDFVVNNKYSNAKQHLPLQGIHTITSH